MSPSDQISSPPEALEHPLIDMLKQVVNAIQAIEQTRYDGVGWPLLGR
jgi:hypothetical protein